MSDFNFDINAELDQARGKKPQVQPPQQPARKPTTAPSRPPEPPRVGRKPTGGGAPSTRPPQAAPVQPPVQQAAPPAAKPEPVGFGVEHSRPSPSGGSGTAKKSAPQGRVDHAGWKAFQPLPGVFDFVGGERPIALADITRGSVSGVPEPLLYHIQKVLRERFTGATMAFPWGTYVIDERNLVFSQKSSTMRYLLFDAIRDDDGSHVQYAKQWFALHHPTGFDPDFDPRRHMKSAQDELDIYMLVHVAHLERAATPAAVPDAHLDSKLDLLGMNMRNILERMSEQEQQLNEHLNRQQVLETVTLLDRMGLLKGGLPKDPGELVRLLEVNRDVIRDVGSVVDGHVQAEEDRKKRLAREERMRAHLKAQGATT